MMSEETKKAPVIRFKGFFDDWEQRKLGELCEEFQSGKNIKAEDIKDNGPFPVFGGNGIRGYSDTYNHDGVYALVGRQGALCGNMNISYGKAYFTEHAIAVKANISNDTKFLFYLLGKMNLGQYSSQSAQPGLAVNKLIQLSAFVPNSYEQKQISDFLISLDSTIALHLCKQRKLNQLKQSLMREILPQSDSFSPHLRLANFRDPWEKHQLKEVLKVNSGRDYKHLDKGNIPVYGTGGYMLSVDGKLSDIDGIGLGRKGTIDKPQYLKAPFWTVDTLFYLTPFPNYDIYFLYTLIQSINWKSMDESTGVPSLSKSVIERVTLTFPVLEEQQKIGSVFKQLDDTIILHQKKVAHLKTLKCTLLNKMFI